MKENMTKKDFIEGMDMLSTLQAGFVSMLGNAYARGESAHELFSNSDFRLVLKANLGKIFGVANVAETDVHKADTEYIYDYVEREFDRGAFPDLVSLVLSSFELKTRLDLKTYHEAYGRGLSRAGKSAGGAAETPARSTEEMVQSIVVRKPGVAS